jgi:hypothetical protein
VKTTASPKTYETQLIHTSAILRERATSLRTQADALTDVLAAAYRRRAAELELEAWVADVQAGVPQEQLHAAA